MKIISSRGKTEEGERRGETWKDVHISIRDAVEEKRLPE